LALYLLWWRLPYDSLADQKHPRCKGEIRQSRTGTRKTGAMKITIIAGAMPPRFDAIGQYSAIIARRLALLGCQVRVLTTQLPNNSEHGFDQIPGVTIDPAFTVDSPSGVRPILAAIEADKPDCVLLQYNPFQYGKWGLNLELPALMRNMKRRFPRICLATMVHETFVPAITPQFVVMGLWQRAQFFQLGWASDIVFISIDPWVKAYGGFFKGKPTVHLPICSTIEQEPTTREEARQRLGITEDTHVLGMFGTLHISRMLPLVRDTLDAALKAGLKTRFLHIGPDGPAIREQLKTERTSVDTIITSEKALDADEVSRRFPAIDVCIAAFADGVSTRRSSFMTGIQHGVATVATSNFHTDDMLRAVGDKGPLLVDVKDETRFQETVIALLQDDDRRRTVAENGARLYRESLGEERVTERLLKHLNECVSKLR